jgi:hypothetical protein
MTRRSREALRIGERLFFLTHSELRTATPCSSGLGILQSLVRRHQLDFVACSLAAALLAHTPLFAEQKESLRAIAAETELSGQVMSASGEAITRAKVSVVRRQSETPYSTFTGGDGHFSFTTLTVGEYRLTVTAEGYKTFSVSRLSLMAGDRVKVDAVMEHGNGSEVVQGSEKSVVSHVGTAVAEKSISDLPENQRNFINVVQVSRGASEGSTNDASSGSRPGAQHQSSAVSLGGQRESTNDSMIDGVDNNERINSQVALHPSIESIGELQVLASVYPANFGHAGGGVINVITKSGTDRLHGSVYEYFRNDLLDSFPFEFGAHNRKPELRQNQFGGSLGGPVSRHHTFFFGDYEGFRLVEGRAPLELTVPTAYEHDHPGDFTDVGGPLLTQLDPVGLAYFGLYPKPNVSGSSDLFVSGANGSNFAHAGDLRIDHGISGADLLFGRFSYTQSSAYIPGEFPKQEEDGMAIEPGGSLTSLPGSLHDAAGNAVLSYSHTFGPHLSLQLQTGYTFWREADDGLNPNTAVNRGFGQPGINLPSTSNGLAPINVIQAAPLGTDGYNRPTGQGDNVFQYSGTATWNRGRHGMSFGAALIDRRWRDIGSSAGLGMWVVNDLPSLLQGQFLQVQRQVDLVNFHYHSSEPSIFIQDEWKALPNLSLSVGLRYDIFTPPVEAHNRLSNFDLLSGKIVVAGRDGVSRTAGVRTDYSGIGPRVGFSWKVLKSATLSAGYGIVSFRPDGGFVYKAEPFIYSFGVCSSKTCSDGFTGLAAGLPFTANPSVTDPSGVLRSMRPFDYHNSYMQQFNVGLEQRHGTNIVRVFYVGTLGRHMTRGFPDINAPPPNTAANPNPLRPFYATAPHLTSIHYIDAEGSSSYNALQASAARMSSKGLTAQLNYTMAHGLDDSSGNTFGAVPRLASSLDYGNSGLDVRHRATASVFYELPFGKKATGARGLLTKSWQLNFSGVWSTGLPFTVSNATDVSNTNPGASGLDRPNQIAKAVLANSGESRFFNTAAFAAQAPGTLGNERNNQLYGPHNRRVDTSLFKEFVVADGVTLQFRTEIFNLTNTANFAAPASVLGGANFGQLTQLTARYSPREIQVAARLHF